MAKFKPGITTNISGSIGSTTFSNSPYGPTMRPKSVPVIKQTELKQHSYQRQVNVTRLWGKITPKQHKGWLELAAKLTRIDSADNEVQVRAYDLFKQLNRNLLEINEPVIFDAPKKIKPKQFSFVDVEISATNIIEDLKVIFKPAIHENTKFIIYASPTLSPGRHSAKKHFYKKISVIDSAFLSGDSILQDYLSVYPLIFYNPFKIAFRFKPVSKTSGFSAPAYSFIQIPS